ncbi:hypothetical protein ACIBF5_09870 [Micromonospora sp. NPDC050417]|uniref:hypothetical protein n=1 Tax=Micromonospora sp. NPDC050417 TaxID=3364280 RepID=UPI003797D81D
MVWVAAGVVALAVASGGAAYLLGRGGELPTLDGPGRAACDALRLGYGPAQVSGVQSERTELADRIAEYVDRSRTRGLADAAGVLSRGAAGTTEQWQAGAAAVQQECLDAGYPLGGYPAQ